MGKGKKHDPDLNWLNDPGDEKLVPDEELFELALYMGDGPEKFTDKEFGKRYADWLKKRSGG